MADPISTVIIDGQMVAKPDFRAYENTRNRVRFASADEVRNADLTLVAAIEIASVPFDRDPTDTTSADDGFRIVVDNVGNRFVVSMAAMRPYLDAAYNLNALQIVNNLGLGTNLQLCLDAGAIASSPGSGTKWLDLSGNGYDFDYGDGSTATTRPTFDGNAGGKSLREYLGLDGGDYLTYDSANEAWMDALHKDNAIFSGILWAYRSAAATFDTLIGTRATNTGGNVGVVVNISSGNKLQFIQRNGTTNQTVGASTFDVGSGAWEMLSFSINEATGASGLILGKNLTFETFTSTYTSPSAAAATSRLNLGTDGLGSGSGFWPNGSRFGMALMWSGTALTQAQIAAFFHATRDRYGV